MRGWFPSGDVDPASGWKEHIGEWKNLVVKTHRGVVKTFFDGTIHQENGGVTWCHIILDNISKTSPIKELQSKEYTLIQS